MKLTREDFESRFATYREHLRLEVHSFRDSVAVLRQISEHTHDHLRELNLAPGFFHTVEAAMFTKIVLWFHKLFDEKGERGFFNFLAFVEYNRDWLTVQELQRRRSYPDDHWMLQNRSPITAESIDADRQAIRSLTGLRSISILRDKFHGHFDKAFFFDRSQLHADAPVTWDDVDRAGEVMGRILNDYSTDFDGAMYSWSSPKDLGNLLAKAAKASLSNAG